PLRGQRRDAVNSGDGRLAAGRAINPVEWRIQYVQGSFRAQNGLAASNARLARKTSASAPIAPTICSPIGSPSRVIPQGMGAAGGGVRLNGEGNGDQLARGAPEPPDGGIRRPASKAGSGIVGVRRRS